MTDDDIKKRIAAVLKKEKMDMGGSVGIRPKNGFSPRELPTGNLTERECFEFCNGQVHKGKFEIRNLVYYVRYGKNGVIYG